MPSKSANVKNEKQYESLKDKGMSKERAAKIANSPGASKRGGKKSGSGGDSSQGGTTAQKKKAGRKGGKASSKSCADPTAAGCEPAAAGYGRTMRIGYFLSCEEYTPAQLVEQAVAAEEAGFDALWISDHFHPWNDEQGQSPFVWGVIGALSQACRLPVTTAVTCPTVRTHPAIVAHAAATAAVQLEGRFVLGVGSGEALNEHVLGDVWPSADTRLEMLEEAVEVMRELWTGDVVTRSGRHYSVDTARIYTLPEQPPPVYVSGFGPKATSLAARIGDGYISTKTDSDLLDQFRRESGGKPTMAGTKVAYAPTEDEGVDHAHRIWANAGLPGELAQVLPSPQHFEQASQLVTRESTASSVPAGPDPQVHVDAVREYVDLGYDEVYVANMGPHYLDMIAMFGKDVLPQLRAS